MYEEGLECVVWVLSVFSGLERERDYDELVRLGSFSRKLRKVLFKWLINI